METLLIHGTCLCAPAPLPLEERQAGLPAGRSARAALP